MIGARRLRNIRAIYELRKPYEGKKTLNEPFRRR